jgi:hypothetical protein
VGAEGPLTEMLAKGLPCLTLSPSKFSATPKDQHVPKAPWFLTGVTAPLSRQSMVTVVGLVVLSSTTGVAIAVVAAPRAASV